MKKTLCIISFLMLSCNFNTFYIAKNDSIPVVDREEIKKMAGKIYEDLVRNRREYILSISDSLLIRKMYVFDSDCKYLSFDNEGNVKKLDEYLIKNTQYLNIDSVCSDEHGYVFRFKPDILSYVYLLPLKLTDKKITCLLSLVFNKNGDIWKLSNLFIGGGYYAFNDHTAIDYYQFSKEAYKQGKLLSVYFYNQFILNSMYPALNYFHYKDEKNMTEFINKINTEVMYKKIFPLAIENVNYEPQILNVSTKLINGNIHKKGLYSYIYCMSKIDIMDTVKIRRIASDINKVIDKYIPEVNNVNDSIGYRFYNYSTSDIKQDDEHYTVFLPINNHS